MVSGITLWHYAKCHQGEYHYSDCHHTKYNQGECHGGECRSAKCLCTDCHGTIELYNFKYVRTYKAGQLVNALGDLAGISVIKPFFFVADTATE